MNVLLKGVYQFLFWLKRHYKKDLLFFVFFKNCSQIAICHCFWGLMFDVPDVRCEKFNHHHLQQNYPLSQNDAKFWMTKHETPRKKVEKIPQNGSKLAQSLNFWLKAFKLFIHQTKLSSHQLTKESWILDCEIKIAITQNWPKSFNWIQHCFQMKLIAETKSYGKTKLSSFYSDWQGSTRMLCFTYQFYVALSFFSAADLTSSNCQVLTPLTRLENDDDAFNSAINLWPCWSLFFYKPEG